MRNFNKSFPTLDEFISECIKMCPIVDERDNVIHLKQPLNSSRANVNNFPIRIQELEKENNMAIRTASRKNSNRCNKQTENFYMKEKSVVSLRIKQKIDLKLFYLVRAFFAS